MSRREVALGVIVILVLAGLAWLALSHARYTPSAPFT